jgi:hypothetical protein
MIWAKKNFPSVTSRCWTKFVSTLAQSLCKLERWNFGSRSLLGLLDVPNKICLWEFFGHKWASESVRIILDSWPMHIIQNFRKFPARWIEMTKFRTWSSRDHVFGYRNLIFCTILVEIWRMNLQKKNPLKNQNGVRIQDGAGEYVNFFHKNTCCGHVCWWIDLIFCTLRVET